MILHIVHVSGKRMIAQGTDGLSRGDHSTGVLRGMEMSHFIPLHLSALSRSAALSSWIEEVFEGLPFRLLTPEDWYSAHTTPEIHVWVPPPAAADAAVERLRVSRHMRPNSLHVVILPRLMTGRWRKQLGKASDCYFRLDGDAAWDLAEHFEPLLIYCCFPFLPHRPVLRERASLGKRFLRVLSEATLSEESHTNYRPLLRKLFGKAWALRSL